ncbi:hypothetical protein [Asticcacaulis benevestitus]|uniref:Uncharacterized protein n=1 Tax=Asticcacaulis benevestitus DSM 16100 = ATCC BAA-896 TaxID=1121022 RepID=V4PW93_9CAUL|nr:hypothetical protein [Asticcacaulis benevestitus]ESQ92621.1 hypothetical protein ABENE_07325 [Asticcacaulis benevestitus DSM 16100 = ATCC BAA-896]
MQNNEKNVEKYIVAFLLLEGEEKDLRLEKTLNYLQAEIHENDYVIVNSDFFLTYQSEGNTSKEFIILIATQQALDRLKILDIIDNKWRVLSELLTYKNLRKITESEIKELKFLIG